MHNSQLVLGTKQTRLQTNSYKGHCWDNGKNLNMDYDELYQC